MIHNLSLAKYSFDKIVAGTKKIELRLYDEKSRKIKLHDVIQFNCESNKERVWCLVRGVVVLENFNDLIDLLPVKLFGYDNREEVKLRIARLYPRESQVENHVVGFLIMPLQAESLEKEYDEEYLENKGRDMINFNFVTERNNER